MAKQRNFLRVLFAIFSIASSSYPAWSAEVFRCQNTYSDLPCSNAPSAAAQPVDTDARTAAQTRQAQRAATQQQASAQQLQAARTAQDAQHRQAQRIAAQDASNTPTQSSLSRHATSNDSPGQTKPSSTAVTSTLRSERKQGPSSTPFFIAKGPASTEQGEKPKKK
jgi:hypothetical protein